MDRYPFILAKPPSRPQTGDPEPTATAPDPDAIARRKKLEVIAIAKERLRQRGLRLGKKKGEGDPFQNANSTRPEVLQGREGLDANHEIAKERLREEKLVKERTDARNEEWRRRMEGVEAEERRRMEGREALEGEKRSRFSVKGKGDWVPTDERKDIPDIRNGMECIVEEGIDSVFFSTGINSYYPGYRRHNYSLTPIAWWGWDTGTSVLGELEFVDALTRRLEPHTERRKAEAMEGLLDHLGEHLDEAYIDYYRHWRGRQYARLSKNDA
ncbi:hypothetical protein DFH27DRAFT_609717 [Peziza echinospora]|nr:hypothetical protein DFH27DRAFT_609717 [Peziza echinospora]